MCIPKNKDLCNGFFRAKEIVDSLSNSDDRSAAILGATIIDELLRRLLERRLVQDTKVLNDIFEFNGALGPFSSRINMCYLLGEISNEVYRELEILRKIRNTCAHNITQINLDNIELLRNLSLVKHVFKGVGKQSLRQIFLLSIGIYIVVIVKRITRVVPFTKRPYELHDLAFEDIDLEYMDKNFK